MTGPKLIGLVRVSTDKQGDSGLGLDAQEAAIDAYRRMVGGDLIKTYVEVESGMHDDVRRPAPAPRRRRPRQLRQGPPGHRQDRPPGPLDPRDGVPQAAAGRVRRLRQPPCQ